MKRKYYEVRYTRAVGGTATINVKARCIAEALANAEDNCFTGPDFHVIREIAPTKNTVKGSGKAMKI